MEILVNREYLRKASGGYLATRQRVGFGARVRVELQECSIDELKFLKASQGLSGAHLNQIKTALATRKQFNREGKPTTLMDLRNEVVAVANSAHAEWFFHVGTRGELTPYKMKECRYTPRDRNREAHATLHLVYYVGPEERATSKVWYATDGTKTAIGHLNAVGLTPATKEMFDEYLQQLKRYRAYFDEYGTQFVCRAAEVPSRWWWRADDDEDESVAARLLRKGGVIEIKERRIRAICVSYEEYTSRAAKEADFQLSSAAILPFEEDNPTPYALKIPCVNLETGTIIKAHAINLRKYKYREDLNDKLVLPREVKDLVLLLTAEGEELEQTDVMEDKGKATIIICKGGPGTGKTLMAEVVAESVKKPLYRIQASQLGIEVHEVEKNLKRTLSKVESWGAVLLIDEADVFIQRREGDLNRNAIVGVFLRQLEYCNCTVFMNTNRASDIDDAMISRADAVIHFDNPELRARIRIWKIHNEIVSGGLTDEQITSLAEEFEISGRTIKKAIALAKKVALRSNKGVVSPAIVKRVMRFVPGGPVSKLENQDGD